VVKVIYNQSTSDNQRAMHKTRLSLCWSHDILARERRQTEDSYYYEEHEGTCLYGLGICW